MLEELYDRNVKNILEAMPVKMKFSLDCAVDGEKKPTGESKITIGLTTKKILNDIDIPLLAAGLLILGAIERLKKEAAEDYPEGLPEASGVPLCQEIMMKTVNRLVDALVNQVQEVKKSSR